MMIKKIYSLVLALVLIQSAIRLPEASASSRSVKKFGVGVGLITEPFPSVIGYNVSYNLAQFLRLGVGYGSISASGAGYSFDVKTIAVDAKAFLLDWNLSPFVNLGFTNVSGTISGTGSASGLSLTSTGSSIYYGGGLDWQTNFGFNIGFDFKVMSIGGQSLSAPGAYFGWYF
jgi:hypothetical protein